MKCWSKDLLSIGCMKEETLVSTRKVFETPTEVLLKNQIVINDIRQKNQERMEETGTKLKCLVLTYGCQMNEHDSEKLGAMLADMDFEPTDSKKEADLIIFNTCCVRENAELKVFGNLGALKKFKLKKPSLKIVVCGCMMQQPHIVEEIKEKYPHVSLIFGTHNLHNFPSLLSQTYGSSKTLVEVWDEEGTILEGLPVNRKIETKAFVNIMFGCNNFCTYCIVPYTRGRERSREPEVIIEEIESLVKAGVREVTLLGQNVNSYGKTLTSPVTFPELLKRINAIEGLLRIRFMTSHPKDISDELLVTMSECDKVCKYLHLPVQSGSNKILKQMNRHYTREQYIGIIKRARDLMPEITFSTDIIIGFPGETEEDNEATIDLIREVAFDSAFTFMYSVRKETPAAAMDNHLSEALKKERFNKVLNVHNPIVIAKNRALKDHVVEVLVENVETTDEKTIVSGRTDLNHVVNFPGDPSLKGRLCRVKITDPKRFSLNGELLEILV